MVDFSHHFKNPFSQKVPIQPQEFSKKFKVDKLIFRLNFTANYLWIPKVAKVILSISSCRCNFYTSIKLSTISCAEPFLRKNVYF